MKTPEELAIEYNINKKKKTLRSWERKYNFKIDLDNFNHFKENKKYYIELRKYEKIKEKLNPDILNQCCASA
jgi:hypothetical protein